MNPLALLINAVKQRMASQPGGMLPPGAQYGQPTQPGGMMGSTVFNGDKPENNLAMAQQATKTKEKLVKEIENYKKGIRDQQAKQVALDADIKNLKDTFLNEHAPEHVQAKKLTDSQVLIPMILAGISSLGRRPDNPVPGFAQKFYQDTNARNEQDAATQNSALEQAFKDKMMRTQFALREMGDQRDRMGQDITKSEGNVLDLEGKLAQEEGKDSRSADLKAIAESRMKAAQSMSPTFQKQVVQDLYESGYFGDPSSPEAVAEYNRRMNVFGADPLKSEGTAAGIKKTTAQAEDIVATRAARIAKDLSVAGVNVQKADEIAKRLSVFDEDRAHRIAMDKAKLELARDRFDLAKNSKDISLSRQADTDYGQALTSQLGVIKAEIVARTKELQDPANNPWKVPIERLSAADPQLIALKKEQEDIVKLQRERNQGKIGPKAPAP